MRKLLLALLGVTALGGAARAQTLTTMYRFTGKDVRSSALVTDGLGNLYGTTSSGGVANDGTVFEFTPATGTTTRAFQTLHSFAGGTDGATPLASLTYDAPSGLLYGTTQYGGGGGCGSQGCGTVFSLNPTSGAYATLYAFTGVDGQQGATSAVVIGSDGALYGTTTGYGYSRSCIRPITCGTVFKFDPANGQYTTLHTFSYADGTTPTTLVFGKNGMLYGLAEGGGYSTSRVINGFGLVFMIDSGTNAFSIAYKFPNNQGPAALAIDPAQNLYVTMQSGGYDADGGIAKIVPNADGTYTGSLLFSFNRYTTGQGPSAPVSYDSTKNLLYTTADGGGTPGLGTLVSIDPDSGAATVLYNFIGSGDGGLPRTGVLINLGMLYGSTSTSFYLNERAGSNGTLWKFPRF